MQDQQDPTLSVSIASLCYECDQWMKRVQGEGSQTQFEDTASPGESEYDQQINRSLLQAICAFSARWLLLNDIPDSSLRESSMDRIDDLWRTVRRDTLRVMNRPCYRSALTLFLFASTPIPVGISEEEESDGVPAQVCVQAALQQVLTLRALQRSIEFNGSKVSPIPHSSNSLTNGTPVTNSFLGVESMVYWAAMTFDTSSSLTLNTKSLLSPGLNLGTESDSPWRLAQTCTNIFHQETDNWRAHGVYITEEIANQIIASAASYKLFIWKAAAAVKEALREGLGEGVVQKVFATAVDAVEQFSLTYRELLAGCERRIQFFGHDTKLRWYEVILHYNLSILIMLNAIEMAERTDLLEKMAVMKASAEGTLFNCLIFGLNNHFHIPRFNDLRESQEVDDGEPQGSTRSVPLIAIDPYPHHVVAAVRILWKAVERDLENNCLDEKIAEKTQRVLLDTLTLLPQASKSVNIARQQAAASFLGRPHSVDNRVVY
ncbi:hypothetical protein PISL3812_04052 [Talaromyces islandicus]|uniref:Uncharacterized protein n=1 Tax=Talaromyces islandicus TaxID=28573 RepID=A0A0U1LUF8_TALIS|nr:hypothetical protein PISL3812_04052 [Talaromyces islandicus]